MQTFEQIRSYLAANGYTLTIQEPFVLCVELSLGGGARRQAIFLSELEDDDGRRFLRVSSVVAPVARVDARRALAFNWSSRVGHLAAGDLDGETWIQLCENRPYESLDAAEVDRLILEIGGVADSLERALSRGDVG